MKRTSRATVTAATLLLLAACSGGGAPAGAPTQAPSPSTTASASPSASPSFPESGGHSPAPTGLINEDTGQVQENYDVPTWDPESREAALNVATRAMRAFARPGADAESWWSELEPLLSDQAAHDYAYVDPAAIPARKITGGAKIVDDASAFVAVVQVPTDVGPYKVTISRQDAADEWRVDRLTPPQEATR
jgi:hypothetical protein